MNQLVRPNLNAGIFAVSDWRRADIAERTLVFFFLRHARNISFRKLCREKDLRICRAALSNG
jgi:hypothetical protein